MHTRTERRQEAKEQVKNARERTEQAISEANGNPDLINVVRQLQDELQAVEDFLNIDEG